jgi:hypothetical protein
MTDLPQPLTPADCDLAGYRWMPLDVERVIDSDTFGLSTGDEFKTAFRLWAKSWKQVPAASLPNDDKILAHLAGLEPATWKKRKAVALRGWILCNDGRLYHPVIAEKALEAMGKREAHNEREQNQQTRQQRYRERRRDLFEILRGYGVVVSKDTKMDELERLAALHQASPSVTQSVTSETSGDVTPDASATAIDIDITGQDKDINPRGNTHAIPDSPRVCAKPAELSAAMRRHSIEAQSGDPRVIAAAANGVTVETVDAASVHAKAKKPGERIHAGYVLSIAEAWTREAAKPAALPSPHSRTYHDDRADTLAKLTGRKAAHEPAPAEAIDVDATEYPRKLG